MRGVLDRYEVYYNGDIQDMSESLRALTIESDKQLASRLKAIEETVLTGRVNDEYSVEGKPLGSDMAEIKVYITTVVKSGIGDKSVFANQMKSVIGEVMEYPLTTESGQPVDAVFGQRSITKRIVLSPELIGTTTSLLIEISKQAVKIYEGK